MPIDVHGCSRYISEPHHYNFKNAISKNKKGKYIFKNVFYQFTAHTVKALWALKYIVPLSLCGWIKQRSLRIDSTCLAAMKSHSSSF